MTQQSPINPPTELIQQWLNEEAERGLFAEHLAAKAARWGADQELQACINWLHENDWKAVYKHLRDARRPEPPSLKEQALEEVGVFEGMGTCNIDIIRRALESLPE